MEELRKRVSTSALHDTSTRQGDQTTDCHPKTRRRLLGELADVLGNSQNKVNWLYGPAGAGKTSIMRSLASLFEQRGQFIGGFHFWRSDSGRNTLKHFVATLAFQLAQNEPKTFPFITRALTRDSLLLDKSTKTQMEKLVIEPLLACSAGKPLAGARRCILVDGLDECDEDGQREFLEACLPTLISRLSSVDIAFFISSRPERAIDNFFTHPRLSNSTNRIFLEPSFEDVQEFLAAEFEEINRCHPKLKKKYGGKWPKDQQLDRLVEKSSGYFILCATAMRHINPPILHGRPPDQRLDDVLEAVSADTLRPLDALYLLILRQHAPKLPVPLSQWKRSIGLVCMALDLSDNASPWLIFDDEATPVIELWHEMDVSTLEELLSGLESLLYFDEETGQPKIYHASFPDFIFNQSRSQEFFMDSGYLHSELACVIVKTLNSRPPPTHARLWTDAFSHHLEHAAVIDDKLGRAIDDINWADFTQRWEPPSLALDLGVFGGLHFIASAFTELQKVFEHCDVPHAFRRHQCLVARITPIAKALLDVVLEDIDDPEGFLASVDGDVLAVMWKCLTGPRVEWMSSNILNPLHTHSTLCLQRQSFPVTSQERWEFTCIQTGCLSPDSDDYQALAASLKRYGQPFHARGAYRIWALLTQLHLDMHPMISFFFNEGFSRRCSEILLATIPRVLCWAAPQDKPVEAPSFRFDAIDLIIQYLGHSYPVQELLDDLWELFFLHDGGRFFGQLKYYSDNKDTRTELENPVYLRATKQILTYFNRCVRLRLFPKIVTEITAFRRGISRVEVHIRAPFSEDEQRDMWSKYSTLIPYVPLSLPDDPQPAAAAKLLPLTDGAVVTNCQSTSRSDSVEQTQESESSSPCKLVSTAAPGPSQSEPAADAKMKKKSFWRRLKCF